MSKGYKILFVTSPVPGHVNPLIEIVTELVKQGNDVTFYANEPMRPQIESTGAKMLPYDNSLTISKSMFQKLGEASKKRNDVDMMLIVLQFHVMNLYAGTKIIKEQQYNEYDIIFYTPMLPIGRQVARQIKTKCAGTVMPTFVFPEDMNIKWWPSNLTQLYEYIKMQAYIWFHMYYLHFFHNYEVVDLLAVARKNTCDSVWNTNFNIIFAPKEFVDNPKVNDSKFVFQGPFIRKQDQQKAIDSFPFDKLTRPKTIYISLGTVSHQQTFIFGTFMKAYSHPAFKNFNIILVCGNPQVLEQFGKIPENFVVVPFAPQLEILKKTDLFICHGGMNSIFESIMFQTRQIVLPATFEREANAARIKKLGLGDYLPCDCRADQLRDLSLSVLDDQNMKKQLKIYGPIVEKQNAKDGVASILSYLKQNT